MFHSTFYILPVLLLYGIRKYIERKWGKCRNEISLDRKVVLITGANSGIGFEVTKELAARHANIILACRDIQKAKDAINKIKRNVECSGALIPMELDLGSLSSIKNFVTNFKKEHKELHILINNAGVSYPKTKPRSTKDGLEIHFGVNYLGHFYLTNLLLDVLEKSTPSRIVVVTSKLHEKGKINLDDLNSEKSRSNYLYSDSKLANIYFCKELTQKIKDQEIKVLAVCPGWIYTNLFRHSIKWFHYFMLAPIAFFFMRSARQGAETIIYCATEPGLETGTIYRDCNIYKSSHEFNAEVSVQLWNKSEEILKKLA